MLIINNCPSTLATGHNTYSTAALRRLFDGKKVSHIANINYDEEEWSEEIVQNVKRISISGVQEKVSAVVIKGKVCLTPESMQGCYIIKPVPNNRALKFRQQIPANENLTMQMARQIFNIQTAENGLVFFPDDKPAYITKRFDIASDGLKIKQEDFASLLSRTSLTHGEEFKYGGSYEDIAFGIRKYVAAWQPEMAKFFKLIVFNYLFCNSDAHLKNFSLQQTPDGDYRLTPAYDLMNASIHIDDADFALENGLSLMLEKSDVYKQTSHPCREDFVNFGLLIGLNEVQVSKVIAPFLNAETKVLTMIGNSFLDERSKRTYTRIYYERMSRFVRK